MRNLKRQLLAGPYALWMAGFVLLPIAIILYYAFTTTSGDPTLLNVTSIFASVHMKSLILSIELALICTIACLALSYPLAMALHALYGKKRGFAVFLFILPMWMNFMLRILAWKMLLSNNGVINMLLGALGLPALDVMNTPFAVVFCMVYDFLPFMVLPIYNSLTRIDTGILEAARDLGAGSVTVFLRVILPLTMPGVVSGVIMVFVPALTSFAISDLLGGGKVLLIGNVIEQAFIQEYNWNLGSGLSLVLMVFVIASMALMNARGDKGDIGLC